VRLPSFSRQSETTTETADRAPVTARTDAPAHAGATRADRPADLAAADRAEQAAADRARVRADERRAEYARTDDRTAPMAKVDDRTAPMARVDDRTERFDRVTSGPDTDRTGRHSASVAAERDHTDHRPTDLRHTERDVDRVPVGPKPRASLLATLGLITGVGAALLVLSGPLLGYGIGLAVLSLILSLMGLRATKKRHVAGKTDALIGLVLALASIVVGVLALTGSLSWLGTDMQPVTSLREWLDARFVNRF
jgi:hypothetical protein